jgi:protein O-mannosyl-transferase
MTERGAITARMTALRIALPLVGILALLAHLPSLQGDFVYDDDRFVRDHDAVHTLSLRQVGTFFTDPETYAASGGHNIYRPLRTLDFAVDWAVSGGQPWFFHLRSMLYHALGSILLLLVFRRLLPTPAALAGAVLFAVHPVHVESVAWISSRGDMLLCCFFLGALYLHLRGRTLPACLLLLGALLSKETAVVFPAAVVLVDLYRRKPLPWKSYLCYAVVTALYLGLWFTLTSRTGEGVVGQTPYWLGGSRFYASVTAIKGLVYYTKLLVLPVELVLDYYVPARATIDTGAVLSMILLTLLVIFALTYTRESRFALLWILITISPVLGVVVRMMIPTTERFLLLPTVGFSLFAGTLLARTRLRFVVFACFLALTVQRGFDWRTADTLWESTLEVAETPQALDWKSRRAFDTAWMTRDRRDVEKVVATAVAFRRLFEEDIQFMGPQGRVLPGDLIGPIHIRALLATGDLAEALTQSLAYARVHGQPEGYYLASLAHQAMGRTEEEREMLQAAWDAGMRTPNISNRLNTLPR